MADAAAHTMPDMPRTPSLSPDAIPIAREIYRRMVEAGFSQKTLADAAGVNATYCRDLFAGRSKNPKSDQLQLIAKALDCTVEDLQNPGNARQAAPNQVVQLPSPLQLRPAEIPVLKVWRLLDRPHQDRIFNAMLDAVDAATSRKADNIRHSRRP
jgi:transcriptional regulator with XRE-family HTH domain